MEAWLRDQLERLRATDLLREPEDAKARKALSRDSGEPVLDACSNDYLGLGARVVSRETLERLSGAALGAGASRLVQGTFDEHEELEDALAGWVGAKAALLGVSAFSANVGTLPALVEEGSLIVSDSLNHASIIDGCRLAKARLVVTPHLELEAVEQALRGRSSKAPAWVVTEGLFSMDGDSPNLGALRALCDRYEAGLYVDEAHSLGVYGPAGAGLAVERAVLADVIVGGLGKAVGSQGGFVAGSESLRAWLWNRARAFVFSTAASPALTRLTLLQVRSAQRADAERHKLQQRSRELRAALRATGLAVLGDEVSPIVPVVLGSNERALRVTSALRRNRILAQAIRPPTVPVGAARLRLTAHADWRDDAVPRIVEALEAACAS